MKENEEICKSSSEQNQQPIDNVETTENTNKVKETVKEANMNDPNLDLLMKVFFFYIIF